MKTIIIKSLDTGSYDIISDIPDHISANSIVEKWQKRTIHYAVHKTLPEISWKIAESNNFVDCLIESAKM